MKDGNIIYANPEDLASARSTEIDRLMHKTKQDKTGQDKTRQSKTRQGKTRQGKTRQGKTRQDKTRQDKARQDKTRQSKTRQSKTRQDKTYDRSNVQSRREDVEPESIPFGSAERYFLRGHTLRVIGHRVFKIN